MRPSVKEDVQEANKVNSATNGKVPVAEWRYGPAQLWYDMIEVDHAGQGFDYGFKLKSVCIPTIYRPSVTTYWETCRFSVDF